MRNEYVCNDAGIYEVVSICQHGHALQKETNIQ